MFYTLISVSALPGILPRDVSTKNETEVTHLGDVVHHRVKRWKDNFKFLSHYFFYLSIKDRSHSYIYSPVFENLTPYWQCGAIRNVAIAILKLHE